MPDIKNQTEETMDDKIERLTIAWQTEETMEDKKKRLTQAWQNSDYQRKSYISNGDEKLQAFFEKLYSGKSENMSNEELEYGIEQCEKFIEKNNYQIGLPATMKGYRWSPAKPVKWMKNEKA